MHTTSHTRAGANGNRGVLGFEHPVLVAGGAGFIGSHLCERLLRGGYAVICLDNFSTSDPENIAHLRKYRDFEVVRADVAELIPSSFARVGAIFNLACAASPVRYQRQPRETLLTCVRGMDNLLELARRDGVRIFQASTSEIYGHPQVHPQTESYWGYVNTMGPRACYDEGKRCAETLCYIYQESFGVAVRLGRVFNTYGPRMHMSDGRVMVNFITQALKGEPLTVYGDGGQTRSFCYVDDMVDAMLRMMLTDIEYAAPINLGNPAEITILTLAKHIVASVGSKSEIVMGPLPLDDPPRRRPNVDLAKRLLDWQPRTGLDAGLLMTVEYFERRMASDHRMRIFAPARTAAGLFGADAR